jgi:hypothetical protein
MVSGNAIFVIFTIPVHNPSTLPFVCQWGIFLKGCISFSGSVGA